MELNHIELLAVLVMIGTYCSVELYKRLARRFDWPPAATAVIRDLVALLIGTGVAYMQQDEPLWIVLAAVVYAALGALIGAGGNALVHRVKRTMPGLEKSNLLPSGGGHGSSNF